jgi:phage tail sheath gpL-like
MSEISTAIDPTRVSSVIGYALDKGFEGVTGGFLPQRIAIIAEANTANQAGLKTKLVFTSADEVALECGYGSPAHLAAKRIRGNALDVGGVSTVVYPLPENVAAVTQEDSITVTGTASKSATQFIIVAGIYYSFTVLPTDTGDEILGKIKDAVNAFVDAPVTMGAVAASALPSVSKWAGVTAADIVIEFAGEDVGLTFAVAETQAGAGEVLPADALALFGNEWNTTVINCLGSTSTVLDDYELFNGNSTDGIGRYNAENWKPFIVITGTIEDDKDLLIAITTGRKNEQTNVVMPAPKSLSLPFEIAAVTAGIYTPRVQRDPKSDILDVRLIGITPPQDLVAGDMDVYNNRDFIVKNGCSTTVLADGDYFVKDFVTTYHPDGEDPPQFRNVRNLAGIDFNTAFRTLFLDETFIKGNTILPDSSTSTDPNVIKPKDGKSIMINKLIIPFANFGIFADAQYSIENMQVGIDGTNPDRLNFSIPYKRSGFARIISTNAVANFFLGGN